MFYAGVGGGVRELSVSRITAFLNGLSIVKWTNYRTDGAVGNNENYYDTDIPLFRYAEVLLTRAEACSPGLRPTSAWDIPSWPCPTSTTCATAPMPQP